jgi:colicin import membrane protein
VKVDKTLVASVALHVLVLGWAMISFSARSYEAPPESLVVDVISADQLAKITAGIKNGEKDKPKPLVEKPLEKKPDPPKPVAENKPKDEPKPIEKQPDPKVDPIAEALKSEESKKPKPKQEAKAAPPQPPKPKQERVFDQSRIAALLDKRDPTRQSITGATLNASASLGTHTGNADAIVATWKGAFVAAVRRCFSFPYNGQDSDQFEVDMDIQLRRDGSVASEPVIVAVRGPSRTVAEAMAASAKRAVEQCQAYAFLPKEQYDTWKYIPMTFGLKDML